MSGEGYHTVIRVIFIIITILPTPDFVTRGEAPVQLVDNGAKKWHISNLVSETQEAANPLDEGSLFRFNNLEQPIASSNCENLSFRGLMLKKQILKC